MKNIPNFQQKTYRLLKVVVIGGKSFLFSATALVLVGGAVSADEVSQDTNQDQQVTVVTQDDNQPAETNQGISYTEVKQTEQSPTTSEETPQVQEEMARQEEVSKLNNQGDSNQPDGGVANQVQQSTETGATSGATHNN